MSVSAAMSVARELVKQLRRRGVTEVVLSPGSRSGPIALAFAAADAQGLLRLHVRVDEREAGFVALGLAKASGRPVPVLTTSGTAVVNLHPALLEAVHAQVPVVAVSADRPERLWGTGANQTTHQLGVLAPLPTLRSVSELPERILGPVHLNLELDQPLIDSSPWLFDDQVTPIDTGAADGFFGPVLTLGDGPRTVVIAGDNSPAYLAELAERAAWPILAEPSSKLRGAPTAIATGRLLLAAQNLGGRIERVISAGHSTLSRPITELLSRTDIPIVHIGDGDTFPVHVGDNVSLCWSVKLEESTLWDSHWLEEWIAADSTVSAGLPGDEVLDVARAVADQAVEETTLILGPSQVLRDMDLVLPARKLGSHIYANRGLAGIDGVISTAIGVALSSGVRSLAYMGDLTFLHGSNGLLLGPDEPRPDLTIVVANDDGGSIFSSLEQGAPEFADYFERVYATGVGASIAHVCAGFGIAHQLVTAAELPAVLSSVGAGIRVVEVQISREGRRKLTEAINRCPAELL